MMLKRIGANTLRYLLTLLVASLVIFIALRVIPGNPAEVALGVTATDESVAKLSATMGIDKPLWQQYVTWVQGLVTGNLGMSLTSGADISPLVFDRLQVSIILVGCAMVMALGLSIPLGVWAARRARKWDGVAITVLSQIGIAIPSFLAAILLVAWFAVRLKWVPANGWSVPSEDFGGFVARLILPVISLGIVQAAIMTRYVRSAVLDVMDEDFMRTARAKGLNPGQALMAHGLRITNLLIGAVVIEKVFVIPGLGSMLLQAVTDRDLPTVQTIVMVLVIFAVVVNAMVDVAYAVVDPRTRSEVTA